MGKYGIQPSGHLAVFSTVVDSVTIYNCTVPELYEEMRLWMGIPEALQFCFDAIYTKRGQGSWEDHIEFCRSRDDDFVEEVVAQTVGDPGSYDAGAAYRDLWRVEAAKLPGDWADMGWHYAPPAPGAKSVRGL